MTTVLAFPAKPDERPSNENRKVNGAKRPTNGEVRPREYLEEHEVERLVEGARKSGRYGQRDATLILLAFRHGLRVSELAVLQWGQVNLKSARLYVRRRKNGLESTQPLTGREVRMLRVLQREAAGSPFVFNTERGSGITEDNVRKIVERAGQAARFPFKVHPHMLRHACGYALANKGTDTRTIQDYLGHRSIQHTVRYTKLAPGRFNGLFED
jgi:type 1 fimbriae regulatory protein FimE